MLAAFEALSIDPIPAARMVNGPPSASVFSLFGILVYRLTLSWGFSSTGSIMVVTGEFLAVYAWAMSDSSYIAPSLSALVLTVWYSERGRPLLLVAAAALAAATYLTRYVGLALVPALAALLAAPGSPGRGVPVFSSSLPSFRWGSGPQCLVDGQVAGRSFGLSGASPSAAASRPAASS
jgi:hypothetical protein